MGKTHRKRGGSRQRNRRFMRQERPLSYAEPRQGIVFQHHEPQGERRHPQTHEQHEDSRPRHQVERPVSIEEEYRLYDLDDLDYETYIVLRRQGIRPDDIEKQLSLARRVFASDKTRSEARFHKRVNDEIRRLDTEFETLPEDVQHMLYREIFIRLRARDPEAWTVNEIASLVTDWRAGVVSVKELNNAIYHTFLLRPNEPVVEIEPGEYDMDYIRMKQEGTIKTFDEEGYEEEFLQMPGVMQRIITLETFNTLMKHGWDRVRIEGQMQEIMDQSTDDLRMLGLTEPLLGVLRYKLWERFNLSGTEAEEGASHRLHEKSYEDEFMTLFPPEYQKVLEQQVFEELRDDGWSVVSIGNIVRGELLSHSRDEQRLKEKVSDAIRKSYLPKRDIDPEEDFLDENAPDVPAEDDSPDFAILELSEIGAQLTDEEPARVTYGTLRYNRAFNGCIIDEATYELWKRLIRDQGIDGQDEAAVHTQIEDALDTAYRACMTHYRDYQSSADVIRDSVTGAISALENNHPGFTQRLETEEERLLRRSIESE